jgi:hypothetical protein
MDYALLTLYGSFKSVKSSRPWMPRAFHQYILGIMPPETFRVPGGFIHGAGEGCIVVAPATREMMARSPAKRVRRALERGTAELRRMAPSHVAIDPVLPDDARSPAWLSGSTVAAAGLLRAFEQAFSMTSAKRLAGYEIAVIGTAFHETVALAECLSETVRGVNLAGGKPAALERLASDFWRHAGVASRIHKSRARACSRSRIVLVAGPLAGEHAGAGIRDDSPDDSRDYARDGSHDDAGSVPLPLNPGSVLVDLRFYRRLPAAYAAGYPAYGEPVVIQSPVLETPQPLSAPVGLEPPAFSSLVEAALASTSPDIAGLSRPSARDLRRIQKALEKRGVEATSVWNTRNMMPLDSLTPLLA